MTRLGHLRVFNFITLVLFLLSCYFCVQGDSGDDKRRTAVVAVASDDFDDGERKGDEEDASVEEEFDPEDHEVFMPTDKWQTIKAGQAIPAGLHVQMNLQTGEKMAKLMEGDDGRKYVKKTAAADEDRKAEDESDQFSHQELKKALKNFKANQDDVKSPEEMDKIREKFRSAEELKKDLDEMELNIETDTQIMKRLIDQYQRDDASMDERTSALYDLEFYVHQIDNARDLISIGGFDLIIKALNDSKAIIRKEAAFVLGSAVQSNPKVQVEAIERGAIQKLLHLMSSSQPVDVRKKAMYGISSLIRHFPFAQQKFLHLGGLDSFLGLFKESETNIVPLQVKAVTLLHDLIVEQKLIAEESVATDENTKQQIIQYQQVKLIPEMMKQGWCEIIPSLLQVPEHDVREKVLLAMQLLLNECQMNYHKDKQLIGRLSILKSEYDQHAQEELLEGQGVEDYFSHLSRLVRDIMSQLTLSP
ncbi:nucleotide exchange factor SIL1-like [Asterias amurensis]|uniref:nucleotide exchange factor SIL1-like n=1 Tax=Asterias amurensis TaxID=7602 RepID=UPI003AB61348